MKNSRTKGAIIYYIFMYIVIYINGIMFIYVSPNKNTKHNGSRTQVAGAFQPFVPGHPICPTIMTQLRVYCFSHKAF